MLFILLSLLLKNIQNLHISIHTYVRKVCLSCRTTTKSMDQIEYMYGMVPNVCLHGVTCMVTLAMHTRDN